MKKYKKIIIEIFIALILIITSIYFLTKKEITMSLIGTNSIKLSVGNNYEDVGIKAMYCGKYIKFKCIDITNKALKKSNIDTNSTGEYVISYTINYKGIKKESKRKVKVVDEEAPIIKLISNEHTQYTCPNKDYVEEGYTVTDNYDKHLEDKVIITKENSGIKYEVSDSSGNIGTIFREYKYDDKIPPTIELKGYTYTYIKLNSEYIEPGYTATDNCDGTITNKVIVYGKIDTAKEGTYKITYEVSDNRGNKTSVIRNIRVYEKKEYNEINPEGKIIYLTFDDGPGYYTGRLLEILDAHNVKATFFVTNQFPGYNFYIKEEYEKGHSIGLHTASHNFSSIYSSFDKYFNDLNIIDSIVYNQTGIHSTLSRFPGGASNTVSCGVKGLIPAIAKELDARGIKYYDWNVDSQDTSTTNIDKIANNIINGAKNNKYSVVLQHDIKPNSIEAVSKVIEWGKENGYTFLPLTMESPSVQHSISRCHY